MCGARILPDEFVEQYRIINSHPGYIPDVRGLDSFKWAVYKGLPIGVTTHLINKETVDAGEIIDRKIVEIYWNDTFHSTAQRQYEHEINMLVEAIEKVNEKHEIISPDKNSVVHKRMPHALETRLLDRFENLKNNVKIDW